MSLEWRARRGLGLGVGGVEMTEEEESIEGPGTKPITFLLIPSKGYLSIDF